MLFVEDGQAALTLPLCPPEPSYETVSPMLCPPLDNCSLSANDCPYGFQQDQNGCLLCQCLSSKSPLLPQRWWASRLKGFQGAIPPKRAASCVFFSLKGRAPTSHGGVNVSTIIHESGLGHMTLSLRSFQTTPALTWGDTARCSAPWDTRGMTLAARCASAACPRPSADP